MIRMQKRFVILSSVILLCGAIALTANFGYFKALHDTPPNAIFASTLHYWQDGMFYLAQIQEGKHGNWVNTYLYTEESAMPYLSHWPYILLGKISTIFNISPVTLFPISAALLLFSFLLLSYTAFPRLFSSVKKSIFPFLFFISSTSFMNKLPPGGIAPYWPYELWNTPHFIFFRFSIIPHYLVCNILFILFLLILFTKKRIPWPFRIGIGIGMILFTLLNPIMAAIMLGTYIISVVLWNDDTDRKTTLTITCGFMGALLYTMYTFSIPPFSQARLWEAAQQVKTTPLFLLQSIGPIIPFVIIGIIKQLKKPSPIDRFGIILLVVGYISFYSSIPEKLGISNIRILFPGYYVFFAWFATVGIQTLASWLSQITTVKKTTLIVLLFFLYLSAIAPTIVWELKQKIAPSTTTTEAMQYLPKTTYAAFQFLENTKPYDTIVLGNPLSFMDIRIPALSGHKTVTGPQYATIDYEQKKEKANALFSLAMDINEAKHWLTIHHVTYILYTDYDGQVDAFASHYPFLTPIFSTSTATVFILSL